MRGVGVTRVVTEGNCTPHGSPVETKSPGATNTASPRRQKASLPVLKNSSETSSRAIPVFVASVILA